MKQVVTIGPDGSMSGLQRKRGQGLDLRQFGRVNIKRVSIVTWNEHMQCWHVLFIPDSVCGWTVARRDPSETYDGLGATLTRSAWSMAMGDLTLPKGAVPLSADLAHDPELLAFEDYDDAVAAEVAFLDALRLKGIF